MSVEERLARLEANQAGHSDWLRSIDAKVDGQQDKLTVIGVTVEQVKTSSASNTAKLDDLLKAAHMGRGAWWILVRVGGVLALIVTAAWAVFDKVRGLFH